ncbi:hypothetical protein BO94DRAFT_570673 [Aspergillus sclerotioniger CBS 115572]|uniref:BTB domain-containing protein n=1 Tax=Aspergillus sclerotioniger CBS 115572 TaxID=1450535 RepID=A0A317XCK2_9EURO|nr:hypothetical protein BO94DRAFT_570673 [Aspergillus sclerotioniger CBS 115572]PWY96344.1 hypothetical protein BO94DRAFT_570673 [Aspergillus sclerotioniger CBS 115572]
MADDITVIDPEGEVIFILENPNAPFAVWNDTNNGEKGTGRNDEQSASKVIRVRVSEKHLTLASPVFKTMLIGVWKESRTAGDEKMKEIRTESWDAGAFLLLLNLLHCRHRTVPQGLSLEQLAKLAEIANYYNCIEAIKFFSDRWMELLKPNRPKQYSRDLMLWLWITWAFGSPDRSEAWMIAVKESKSPVRSLGLPFPSLVMDRINTQRNTAICILFTTLNKLRDDLLCDTKGCSFQCRAVANGVLTKLMHEKGLLIEPTAAAAKWSFVELINIVATFSKGLLDTCRCQRNYYDVHSLCQPGSWITEVMQSASKSVDMYVTC